jgi:hypothetical protein
MDTHTTTFTLPLALDRVVDTIGNISNATLLWTTIFTILAVLVAYDQSMPALHVETMMINF